MISDKRHIDKLFKDGLAQYREKPSIHAWDRLDKSLGSVNQKKAFFYFRWAAAVVLLFLAFGAGYYFANLNSIETLVQKEDPNTTDVNDNKYVNEFKKNQSTFLPENQQIITSALPDKDESYISDNASSAKSKSGNQDLFENTAKLFANQSLIQNLEESDRAIEQSLIRMNQLVFKQNELFNFTPAGLSKTISIRQTNHLPFIPKPDAEFERIVYENDFFGKTKNQPGSKWSLGATFAPTYSYRDISTNYSSGGAAQISEEENFNRNEESLLSYSGGINVDYKVSPKLYLQSGLYLSQIGQVNNDALKFEQSSDQYLLYAINTSTGPINIVFEKVPDDVRKIDPPKDTLENIDIANVKIIQQFGLFEIPVMLKYKLLNKKLSVNLSGGLSPAYLLRDNTYLEYNSEKYDIGNSSNLNSFIVNSSLGLGLEYLFTKKFSFSFEPTFKYALNPINKNSQFDYHPYYFSWFTGIKYSF
ncbi:MAG: outer membrane beta-barrel protein [Bacteroidales bacterium]|nr:outer membrane beta-barrel protein [Bacteroidales bacterium]MCF8402611.1 outer membrane beta-barrel protein [Bacteroidales bacterium]